MTNETETQLKELILDDDFTRLQSLVNEEINLMDILRVSHKELAHSNFLAWLFNPAENHNLGDFALKEFIKIYFKENQFQNFGHSSGLSVFDFVYLDFDDLEIRREYKNIDLLFISKKNQFCLLVENKIWSSEGTGQLEKYRKTIEQEYKTFNHKIYIYLSFKDQEISEEEQTYYIQLNYSHITKLVQRILSNKHINIATKTRFVFEQYLQTLKSMSNENEEIEKIAQKLYNKYKSAFKLISKYIDADELSEIRQKLNELTKQHIEHNGKVLREFKSDKTYIRFQPRYLHDKSSLFIENGFVDSEDDLKNSWLFLFEFNVRKYGVNFDFKIGMDKTDEQSSRKILYEIYKKNSHVFNKINKSNNLSPRWHLAFQKQILSGAEIESHISGNGANVDQLMEKRFTELVNQDLPLIIRVLDSELNIRLTE